MQDQTTGPLGWLQAFTAALGWPIVVGGAFYAGRTLQDFKVRATKAEDRLKVLVERHIPMIHRALSEIRGLLISAR